MIQISYITLENGKSKFRMPHTKTIPSDDLETYRAKMKQETNAKNIYFEYKTK